MGLEKNREDWGPIHLAKCFGELAVMYAMEKIRSVAEAIDDAFDIDFGDLED